MTCPDVWQLGSESGDDQRTVRDQNGLVVKRYATTTNALRAITHNNDRYGVRESVKAILAEARSTEACCATCSDGPFAIDGADQEVETTWQQWKCPCCGAWNERS